MSREDTGFQSLYTPAILIFPNVCGRTHVVYVILIC